MAKATSEEECIKRHIKYKFDTLENEPVFASFRREFIQKEVKHGQKILDIGCNSGNIAIWLSKCECWGVDVCPKLVEKAKSRMKAQVARAENLPFKDKQFDVAILTELLEHVYSPELVMREACRVADKLVGTVPSEESVWGKHTIKSHPEHVRCYDEASLRVLLQEFGKIEISILKEGNPQFYGFVVEL